MRIIRRFPAAAGKTVETQRLHPDLAEGSLADDAVEPVSSLKDLPLSARGRG